MTPLDAQKIIDTLAGGIHPGTGEVLQEGVLNDPAVIRALFIASRALGATATASAPVDAPAKPRPGKAGAAWTAEEDQQLLDVFDNGTTIAELAALHQRSRGGITARLVRLGRISDRSEVDD